MIGEALSRGEPGALRGYEASLQAEYGLYFKVASKFMTLMGRPKAMRTLVGTGMYSRTVMEWVLRIMANLLRPDEVGPAELAYKAIAALAERRA